MATASETKVWELLREPFPPELIDKLPKGGTTLDYVGHAAVTDRLLKADPLWNWEPLALDEHGLPAFTRNNNGQPVGLWIKLTVGGVTRLGCGTVTPGAFDAEKQLIGDALRNAAMRFGVALDLWSKSDLYFDDETHQKPSPAAKALTPKPKATAPQEAPQNTEGTRLEMPDWMKRAREMAADKGKRLKEVPELKIPENATALDVKNALIAWRISVSEGKKNAGDEWVLEQFAALLPQEVAA